METDFDPATGIVNLVPQDSGRVLLNLINNAFYAVNERKKKSEAGYEPAVSLRTKKMAGKVKASQIKGLSSGFRCPPENCLNIL